MKKLTIAAVAAFALATGSASAADLVTKAKPIVAPEPPAWDLAFGSAIASDYIFRGVTQSNHKPSVAAYFEPRYNINKDNQLYLGLGGASIDFPNRAAGEVDIYGGWRPTIGPVRVRFRRLVLLVPGRAVLRSAGRKLPALFPERWRRFPGASERQRDQEEPELLRNLRQGELHRERQHRARRLRVLLAVGAELGRRRRVLRRHRQVHLGGLCQRRAALHLRRSRPLEPRHHRRVLRLHPRGRRLPCDTRGIPLPDYTTWNVGFGWTWKVFTVDLRYIDTNLSKGNCNAFTGDHTAPSRHRLASTRSTAAISRTGAAAASSPGSRPT